MAVTFGFYDSLNGDRKYYATQLSQLFNALIKDGIFMHIGEHMNVKEGTGMQINVGPGLAWFNSTWTLNDADYPFTISASDLLQTRIDAIILEIDETVSSRMNSIKVITGTPATDPQKPSLTNTADIHQYPLAYVTVGVGVTSITQANIENCIGTTPCPFVTGVLDTIDATTLLAQWEAQFNEWFENLEDTLSGDVAGNLLNMIQQNSSAIQQNSSAIQQNSNAINAVAAKYKATLTLSGWVASTGAEQGFGYPYAQEVTLTAVTPGAPTVMESSEFLTGCGYEPTGVAATDEILDEVLTIINAGVTRSLNGGKVRTVVKERPSAEIVVNWVIRTEVK